MPKTNVVQKIYADGRIEDVAEKMDLAQMQKFVGGYIEFCPTTLPHRALIVDEEGLIKNKPINLRATQLVPRRILHHGIRGDVLLIKC